MHGFKRGSRFPSFKRGTTRRWSRLPSRSARPSYRRGAWHSTGRQAAVTTARAAPRAAASSTSTDTILQSLVDRHITALSQPPNSIKPAPLTWLAEGKEEKKEDLFDDDLAPLVPADLGPIKDLLASSRIFNPGKIWRFRVGGVLSLSTGATGSVNSVISVSTVATIPAFATLTNLFNEFFVVSMTTRFMPLSIFNIPGQLPTATKNSNQPLGSVAIQGTEGFYSLLNVMGNNPTFRQNSTGVPFTFTWRNYNKYKYSEAPTATTTPTYSGWCPVASASTYLGACQYLTNGAQGEATTNIGTFAVSFDVAWRVKL